MLLLLFDGASAGNATVAGESALVVNDWRNRETLHVVLYLLLDVDGWLSERKSDVPAIRSNKAAPAIVLGTGCAAMAVTVIFLGEGASLIVVPATNKEIRLLPAPFALLARQMRGCAGAVACAWYCC